MKKLLSLIIALTSVFIWSQEQVTSFHADIKIDTSGLIQVSEQIDIVSERNIFKRGIVRYLPLSKKDSTGRRTFLNYEILSVKKENSISPYHTKKNNGNLEIYVGEKDVFIPNGKHHYSITYTAENTIEFFPAYDELYWNVNGFGWDFNIPVVSANIYFPDNAIVKQAACYTGKYGSTQSNCEHQIKGNKAEFKALNIAPNENLTIAAAIDKGFINEPPPPTFFEKFRLLIISLIFSVLLGVYYLFTWRKYGVDPHKPTVYPQFKVPERLSPASMGMIHKEHYWQDLITTSIVNLAVKGYIQIKEKEEKYIFGLFKTTKYTLIKLRNPSDGLPAEEYLLMEDLFSGRKQVELDGKYDTFIESAVNSYRKELEKQHKALINEGNNYKFLVFPVLSIVIFLIIAVFTGARSGVVDQIFQFIVGGISFVPFVVILTIFINKFKINWKWFLGIIVSGLIIFTILSTIISSQHRENWNMYGVLGFLLYAVITFLLYQYFIKRPSKEKLRKQSLIEGFKMYLDMAEEKQLQHFNPPEVTPKVFEKYLPYAIALDAEEVWGEKFKKYLDKSALGESYENNWYVGHNFNAINFGHHLNSKLSNSFNSAASPPSSSGSGSGGGGFSGGGGGGGGGGGW